MLLIILSLMLSLVLKTGAIRDDRKEGSNR